MPTAINAATAATIANALSTPLIEAATGAGAGRRGAVAGAGFATVVAGAAVARDGGGAAIGAGVPGDGAPIVVGAAVGPPGGSVGNLIVGAAEGFGGRFMRTVSFLGSVGSAITQNAYLEVDLRMLEMGVFVTV